MSHEKSTGPEGQSTKDAADCAPKVGNKRPPKHTQFKKGVSGNPAGRPKGALGLKTLLAAELKSSIKIQEGGKTKTVTKQQAMVKQFVGKALKGDDKAFGRLIPLMLAIGVEEVAEVGHALTDQQKEILERNAQRLLKALSQKESRR
jgi:hypothetical protein